MCLVAALFLAAPLSGQGQGTVAYHVGNNNPLSEGWVFSRGFGSPQSGALTNDMGYNAWYLSLASAGGVYSKGVNSILGNNWLLTVKQRCL